MLVTSKYLFLGLFILASCKAFAQEYKLGDITVHELEQAVDSTFPKASAIVLSRKVNLTIGRKIRVYEKIKIVNKEGLEFGRLTSQYYDISEIKGASYNLVNGQIRVTQLTDQNIFTQQDPSGYSITSLSFPELKEGTIIEYSYESSNGIMEDIFMQDYLPIKKLSVEVNNRLARSYTVIQNPQAKLPVNRYKRKNTIVIEAKNIPAIEPLDYVYDMELYSAKLHIQDAGLNSIYNYWDDFARFCLEDLYYTSQLRPSRIYKDDLTAFIGLETDPLAKAKKVYEFIQDSIMWDQFYGTYPNRGTRGTYRNKIGDVADINILLISALRSVKLESYLVLNSTKFNGIPKTVNSEAFNYTLASVVIDDTFYVLDAANKNATFNYLPINVINGRGMVIIDKNTHQWIDLERPTLSTLKIFNQLTIDSSAAINGKTREQLTGYFAINLKEFLKKEYRFKNQIVRYNYHDLRATNVTLDTSKVNDIAGLSYDFWSEKAIEVIEDKMYFEPLLFLTLNQNPFKREVRAFPIDYGFTQKRDYLFTIAYPDSYRVHFIPEPINIALPNDLGNYSYQILPVEGALQLRMQLNINTAVIPAEFYSQLKEFYKIRVNKEKQKVVLVKRI